MRYSCNCYCRRSPLTIWLYLLWCFVGIINCAIGVQTANRGGSSKATHDKENVVARSTRRVKNLDHWDSHTLAHFVGLDWDTCSTSAAVGGDQYAGVDAVVLFYASWCPNCLALAPLYDQLATMLKAGTKSSNLIMALFDCEVDKKHQDLCSAVGVTHYPTLLFIGRDTLHQRPTVKEQKIYSKLQVKKPPKLRRTAKFRGNWQYGEQILDWIRFNHAWSSWKNLSYDHPLIRFIRNSFTLPFLRTSLRQNPSRNAALGASSKVDESLPVGIPASGNTNMGVKSSVSSYEDKLLLKKTQDALDLKIQQSEEMEKAATHLSYVLDALLLPTTATNISTDNNSNATRNETTMDIFQHMINNNVYTRTRTDPTDQEALILYSCVVDLSLDYCNRVLVHIVHDEAFLNSFAGSKTVTLTDIEKAMIHERDKIEPFCTILDECVPTNFNPPEKCQPAKCPFHNELACRYVSTCFDPQIYDTYLKEIELGTNSSSGSATSSATKFYPSLIGKEN
jgi:thiol-disulfide isomerase/thioredoxin